MVIILVGNKCDLVEGRKVSTEEGQQYADKIGATFVETSAKTNHKVEEAMVSLTKEFKKKMLSVIICVQGGTFSPHGVLLTSPWILSLHSHPCLCMLSFLSPLTHLP